MILVDVHTRLFHSNYRCLNIWFGRFMLVFLRSFRQCGSLSVSVHESRSLFCVYNRAGFNYDRLFYFIHSISFIYTSRSYSISFYFFHSFSFTVCVCFPLLCFAMLYHFISLIIWNFSLHRMFIMVLSLLLIIWTTIFIFRFSIFWTFLFFVFVRRVFSFFLTS